MWIALFPRDSDCFLRNDDDDRIGVVDLISLPVCAYPETIDADIRSEKLSKLIIIARIGK
jgi:hypothetical protein